MYIKGQVLGLACLDWNLGSASNGTALGKLCFFSISVFFTCKIGVVTVPIPSYSHFVNNLIPKHCLVLIFFALFALARVTQRTVIRMSEGRICKAWQTRDRENGEFTFRHTESGVSDAG